jgi:hypothetical protein
MLTTTKVADILGLWIQPCDKRIRMSANQLHDASD